MKNETPEEKKVRLEAEKAEAKAKAEAEKAEAKAKAEAEKLANKTSVTVTWRGGVREYTRALHGDKFMDLAKEFSTKKRGTVA